MVYGASIFPYRTPVAQVSCDWKEPNGKPIVISSWLCLLNYPEKFPLLFFFKPQESSTLKTTHPVVGSETRKLGVLKAVRFRFSGGGGG